MTIWIDSNSSQKPPYGTEILMWNECFKCRKEKNHPINHNSLEYPHHGPFLGYYCKGLKPSEMVSNPKMMIDHWSPVKPTYWAKITPPEL